MYSVVEDDDQNTDNFAGCLKMMIEIAMPFCCVAALCFSSLFFESRSCYFVHGFHLFCCAFPVFVKGLHCAVQCVRRNGGPLVKAHPLGLGSCKQKQNDRISSRSSVSSCSRFIGFMPPAPAN